ncbi:MAG: SAM-dependent DNA methyltransferase [Chloroflexi bacterium]|nr:SAM-dependent DNA methyltransferase [Chloroflexota bacterium]
MTCAKLRGFIDALYQDIIFEFKRDMRAERDKGKEELARYLTSLGDSQVYFGVLTDGVTFEVYILRGGSLERVDKVNLEQMTAEDAFSWFDSFLFTEKQLAPTPKDVLRRFGDSSSVFNSSLQRLSRMLARVRTAPAFQVKFREWDKLLAKVYGHSVARDALFLRHSYLSVLVKLLAHSALFADRPKGPELRQVLSGHAFANLPNLVEEDFFCWVLDQPNEGEALELLRGLAQHLAIYDLSHVGQDLLKELYENLVDEETKHDLGEVYTPDWLAELTLAEAGFGPGQRLLDPACGSGTFLFTAIRILREQGLVGKELVEHVLENIVGVDVHPLAVTIARVNYVLALGQELQGYGRPVAIPVYMADSLQSVKPTNIGALVPIEADSKKSETFNIPGDMAATPALLDRTIEQMRSFAEMEEAAAMDGFMAYLKAQGIEQHTTLWRHNLRLMAKLCREGRDTIWAFILKNAYRPAYLRLRPFDLVAGNPPWLSYRYISDAGYQRQVKELTSPPTGYGLLSTRDANLFTHLELGTLFFVLSADVYLKKGGAIAFVMPRSVLTGAKQHARFQDMLCGHLIPALALEKVLDLGQPERGQGVSPLFKVPCCVLISRREEAKEGRRVSRVAFMGELSGKNVAWAAARPHLRRRRQSLTVDKLFPPAQNPSPYLKDIKEGATLVPRSFWFVRPVPSPYGMDQERPEWETDPEVARTAKKPWQGIRMWGLVEAQYLYATLLSRQLLPFGWTGLSLVALPLEETRGGPRMLRKEGVLTRGHDRFYRWLAEAERVWSQRKKQGTREDVYEWLDYRSKLTSQNLTGRYTVLYVASATYLASFVIGPWGVQEVLGLPARGFVIESKTYFHQTRSSSEAHYLCAFLNSPYADQAIKSSQTGGAWGARDIHRRPFEMVPFPRFNPKDKTHVRLAELSQTCHAKVANLAPSLQGKSIGRLRSQVRQALSAELQEIDTLVRQILGAAS